MPLKRLRHLEQVHTVEGQGPLDFQMGYLKKLPPEYAGERHVVTVGLGADGKYRWEERPGAPLVDEDSRTSVIRIFLVRAKDGRPDYSWPEDAHPV